MQIARTDLSGPKRGGKLPAANETVLLEFMWNYWHLPEEQKC